MLEISASDETSRSLARGDLLSKMSRYRNLRRNRIENSLLWKGFGAVPPKKTKGKTIVSTLSPEDTHKVMGDMYEFLEYENNVDILCRMAIRRCFNGEGKGAIVAAPWQHEDPEVIPTHYMVEQELRESGLAYPVVLDSLRRYKPRSEFLLIYWKEVQPETMAACQIIHLRGPLVKLPLT